MSDDPVKDDLERMPDGVPDRRKHGYGKLEEKMDNELAGIRWSLTKFMMVAAVTGMLALGAAVILYTGQRGLTDDIQDQRFDSLVKLCQEQNERHDNTINRISESNTSAEVKNQRIFLVDALQPKVNDCTVDARRRVRGR